MNKAVSVLCPIFLAVAAISGCASIVSKSDYPVSISSQPAGAEISIKNSAGVGVYAGTTPTTVNLKAGAGYFKGETYTVTFKKDEHIRHTAQIERGVDGWYIVGNLFFGGLIGYLIVDPATGAMWTLRNLHVDLSPTKNVSINNGLNVVSLDDVPYHLRLQMVKVN